MFDPELGDLVNGNNINKAYNGLLLTRDLHPRFGRLKVWLDVTDVNDLWSANAHLQLPTLEHYRCPILISSVLQSICPSTLTSWLF